MHRIAVRTAVVALVAASAMAVSAGADAGRPGGTGSSGAVAHWTPERIAAAQPRDLVIDQRGLGYLRNSNGGLTPYGHSVLAVLSQVSSGSRIPLARPSGGRDEAGPLVSGMSPKTGDTVGDTVDFSATITDASGIKSVTVYVARPGAATQSFSAGSLGGDSYGTTLTGFTDGDWEWYLVAADTASRGGNRTTSPTLQFSVDTAGGGGGGGGGGDDVVTNSHWASGGDVQLAAGRILFEMPQKRGKRITGWVAYVCSGTVVQDDNTSISVIVTAAHCVYDDAAKEFARNVLFIPSQDDGGKDGTDSNCSNDPIGCYEPSHGVVDLNWTTRKFPNNVEWDYAYYVVPNSSAHSSTGSASLEAEVEELEIGFKTAKAGPVTHALGYSYSDDPNFMYCAESMQVETADVNWWLPNCGLSGGASGGPWVQPMDEGTGSGPIISVNSWGYTNQPGMAGPLLDGSAACVFAQANNEDAAVVERGVVVAGCTD
jgi:hypothetical protein